MDANRRLWEAASTCAGMAKGAAEDGAVEESETFAQASAILGAFALTNTPGRTARCARLIRKGEAVLEKIKAEAATWPE